MFETSLIKTTLVGGKTLYAHSKESCKGPPCTIHSPSDHHMKDWPQSFREDRGIMERVCACGVGHPDPDDLLIRTGWDKGVHGCCGCCSPPEETPNPV